MILDPQMQVIFFRANGSFGLYKRWLRGEINYEDALIASDGLAAIYQRRRCQGKMQVIAMQYYRPTNPRTPEQQARRAVFRAGVVAYHALTPEQKAPYTKRAKRLSQTAYNVFLSDWLTSH